MKLFRQKKKRIYLDYAAATPIRRAVLDVMRPYEREVFANASAIHKEGVWARTAVERARVKLARTLKIRPDGVLFTSGGTESNNLAILGAVQAHYVSGVAYEDMEVISTRIEHPSINEVLLHLETLGVVVKYMKVDEGGLITSSSLQESLSKKTVIVSFSYANSEIGAVQEVGKLARIVRAFEKKQHTRILVHIDAAQAPLWLPCQMGALLVDIMTLDAGKCYGPKGVGILAIRHGVELVPISYGGGQERGLRPATENTGGIIGAVEAIILAQEGHKKRADKAVILRDAMIVKLLQIDGTVLNGSSVQRIANNINISIPGIDSEFAVVSLDEAGIACATKSACGGADGKGSGVVQHIYGDSVRAKATIRFSLGEETSMCDVKKTIEALSAHVVKMKNHAR